MKLLLSLPNGEEIDLLDEGPNGMDYICQVCGEYDIPVSQLLEDYQHEPDEQKRLKIADEIRNQACFFAGEIANYDENLQQMIGWDELGEQIYRCLIQHAKECALEATINSMYTKYCTENGHEPHFADCAIKWKDTQETVEVRIFLSSGVYDEIDDEIFYYCDGLHDFIALVGSGVEDFIIVQCFYFDVYPQLLNT